MTGGMIGSVQTRCLMVDDTPQTLLNTFGRRQILAGKTNEEVSNLLGLSNHRTAATATCDPKTKVARVERA
ncbi:hypothetical protein CR51_17240 [Caballeronia megalochromosomata]|nr:hypothetical protein CR51_17240 [Caballeronia megalochromosomata]